MPQITLLEQQKKSADRVNVYLDGEFAFGLNVMDAALLRKGQELSEPEIAALRAKDDVVKAVEQGINLLSYRPRSNAEIRQNLKRKNVPDATIDAAIERLQTMGYLDDRAFARLWVENRRTFKPRGVNALRYELQQKGVESAVIAEVLEDAAETEDELAYKAASPKARRLRGRARPAFNQTLSAFLQRRGFNHNAARQAVRRLADELADEDPHFFVQDQE